MYAVIESGGKQHKVSEGDVLKVEKIDVDAGQSLEFDQVLMIGGDKVSIGAPHLEKCKVTAKVLSHGRYQKIKIIKFNRRKHYRNEIGHRQWFTELKITKISG